MRGKIANMNMTVPSLGFLIAALAIILLFMEMLGSFTTIIVTVAFLGGISFFRWFILDYIN